MLRNTPVIGTDRRRGQRIRSSVKMTITSLDSTVLFSGLCNTGTVSFYGCDFLSSLRFKPGTALRLEFPDTQRTTTARVVHSLVAKIKNEKLWKTGVEFDVSGYYISRVWPP
jgi:PilZ domain-containing protein